MVYLNTDTVAREPPSRDTGIAFGFGGGVEGAGEPLLMPACNPLTHGCLPRTGRNSMPIYDMSKNFRPILDKSLT